MKTAYVLTIVVAGLMLAQSSLGLLFRSQYRDVHWVTMTWLGNDWVTLALALPMLAASATVAIEQHTPRSLLLWLGTLAYVLYVWIAAVRGAPRVKRRKARRRAARR